jgi:hypothetical protein
MTPQTDFRFGTRIPVLTSNWGQVIRYAKEREDKPAFVPVQIAVGAPRGVAWARNVPRISELAPYGLLKKPRLEGEEFRSRYLERLQKSGAQAIQARFEAVYAEYQVPLLLLCWEPPGEPCHRRDFARWWWQQTGQRVPEAQGLDSLSIQKSLMEAEVS